jgi:hypothetical protein
MGYVGLTTATGRHKVSNCDNRMTPRRAPSSHARRQVLVYDKIESKGNLPLASIAMTDKIHHSRLDYHIHRQ